MKSASYFGDAVVQAPVAKQTHAFVSRSFEKTPMAITRIVMGGASPEIRRLPLQDACIMTVAMDGGYERDLYLEDSVNPIDTPVPEGSFSFFDMRHHARLRPTSKADDVQFFLPLETINSVAEQSDRPRMDYLRLDAGQVVADPTMARLAKILMPSFQQPSRASWLFIDHIMLAAAAHVATTYGGMRADGNVWRGGLAPWQMRRAMEMLASDLPGAATLQEIAKECGYSARHFSRAFTQSTGMAPHQWLLGRRIDRAKHLLEKSATPLGDIAKICGFSDHSHFTRIFTKHVGIGPADWRRRSNLTRSPSSNPGA